MKKVIVLLTSCALALSLNAKDCKIISSPAMNENDVRGTDAVALSISRFYYDKNKKMQIKSYSDAFLEFNRKALKSIKDECKKYKLKSIYNYKIESMIEKNYYHFNAVYDYN